MSDSYNGAKRIIQELYDEFLKDEKKLTEVFENNAVRIDELDHKIHSLRKSEDAEFKVFSPRSSSNINSEKITEFEKEKSLLESESRNYSKQLRYYSDKVNKLNEVLFLLGETNIKEPLKNIAFKSIPDVVIEEKDDDPFKELFPSYSSTNSKSKDTIVQEDEELSDVVEDSLLDDEGSSSLNNDENIFIKDGLDNIIHKAEFTEKIITSDVIRAKLEIREIIRLLKDLFK